MGKIQVITGGKDGFDKFLADAGGKLVVVDFYADWCGPCRMMAPAVEKLAEEHSDVIFAKVNVDNEGEISESCGISAMPTFQFFKNGQKVHDFTGASEEKLKQGVTKFK